MKHLNETLDNAIEKLTSLKNKPMRKIQDILEELQTGLEDGESPSTYENEFRFLGMNLYISEIEESYTSYEIADEEETNTKKHTILENFRIVSCKVVRTDYGHEDEPMSWIEDLICKL